MKLTYVEGVGIKKLEQYEVLTLETCRGRIYPYFL